ncbi:hypothetical protein DCC62_26255 [candidate division KSB1 bacterium]|nr:MAG: hypothetical protein DCC62_26255 [candidate division KSB1 bacterium]
MLAQDNKAERAGLSWQFQSSGLTSSLRGICVVNDNIAWVSGTKGSFARTLDGGQTWLADSVAGATNLDFRDVQAFDAERAILMSAGSGELSRIYTTADGGKNWQLKHSNKIAEGFFNGFAFWDENNGILVGESAPAVVQGEYGFAASGTNLAVHGKSHVWIATGGAIARVFHSQDRGKTWNVAVTPMVSGNASSGIFSIAFRDENHGVIVGGNYQEPNAAQANAALTTDGGKTWELIKNLAAMEYRSCVAYLTPSLLVAVGPSGSDYSNDGGLTWARFSAEGFHTMSFAASANIGWAAGAEGRIGKLVFKRD